MNRRSVPPSWLSGSARTLHFIIVIAHYYYFGFFHSPISTTSHSVVFPIPPGIVGLVAHLADGSTESETTPARHLPTSGDRPLDAVIMDERRDGPRCRCDHDDELA